MPASEAFYKDLVDNLYDGIYFVDRDRVITYWNKGAERITGYAAGHVVGRACGDNLLNHVTANGVQLCLNQCPLAAAMADGNAREAEVFLHHADGHRVPVMVRAAPLRDSAGAIIGAVETFSNNLVLINARQQLREMTRHTQTDALTGVANRVHLDGRLRAIIAEFNHEQGAAGLLFIDVDHFKSVNDTYCHEVGDRALRMVAATLQHNLRATDVVGRWGGEEFVVLLYDVATREKLQAIADKLRHLVACSNLDVGAQKLTLTISVGATLLRPEDATDTFVRRADALMYRSKQAGRNRVSLDEP